jgi:hypothetical protein
MLIPDSRYFARIQKSNKKRRDMRKGVGLMLMFSKRWDKSRGNWTNRIESTRESSDETE